MSGFTGFLVGIGLMLLIAAIRDLFDLREPPLTDLDIARGRRQRADLAKAIARNKRDAKANRRT